MDITFPLNPIIGTDYGINLDGAIVGSAGHLEVTGFAELTYAHALSQVVNEEANTWQDLTTDLLEGTPTQLLSTAAVTGDGLYFRVEGDTVGFTLNLTTAGVGSFAFQVQYNGPDGYTELTLDSITDDFLKVTGANTLRFTPPEDWQEDYIGLKEDRARWLRIRIVSGTVSTAPTADGGYQISAVPSRLLEDVVVPEPFSRIVNLPNPLAGDMTVVSSASEPFGLEVIYETPQIGGVSVLEYSKADGTFEPLPIVYDSSNGLTEANYIEGNASQLVATDDDQFAVSVETIAGDGYVTTTLTDVPAPSSGIFSLGLSSTDDIADIDFEVRSGLNGDEEPALFVYENNVLKHEMLDLSSPGQIRIVRFDGAIYYQKDGFTFYTSENTSTAELMGIFKATYSGYVFDAVQLVDFSGRLAFPIDLTFTEASTLEADTTPLNANYLGRYFMMFSPPADFASVSLEDSKTGVAGYELSLTLDDSESPIMSQAVVYGYRVLTEDASTNEYFTVASTPMIGRRLNITVADPSSYTEPQTFMLIGNNDGTIQTRLVSFEPGLGTSCEAFSNLTMQTLMIYQVNGNAIWQVGTPSYLVLTS